MKKLSDVQAKYDEETGISVESGYHTRRKAEKDFNMVLNDSEVFTSKQGRKHKAFGKFEPNIMRKIDRDELKKWIDRINKLVI